MFCECVREVLNLKVLLSIMVVPVRSVPSPWTAWEAFHGCVVGDTGKGDDGRVCVSYVWRMRNALREAD